MKALLRGVIFTSLVLFMPSWARAAVWQPVGFGTVDATSRFRVFIDTDSIQGFGGKVRFWQGHVFNEEQPLPSGKTFVRVSISRVVDCNEKSDSSLEAIFYGAGGAIVDKYDTHGVMNFSPVKPATISEAVLNYVCNYANRKG